MTLRTMLCVATLLTLGAIGGCSSPQEGQTTSPGPAPEVVAAPDDVAAPDEVAAPSGPAPRQECSADGDCAEVECDCEGHPVFAQGCFPEGCEDERDCPEICASADIHELE